jgi:hypothetical protein
MRIHRTACLAVVIAGVTLLLAGSPFPRAHAAAAMGPATRLPPLLQSGRVGSGIRPVDPAAHRQRSRPQRPTGDSGGQFVVGPDLIEARTMASAVRLADGRVLVAGGLGGDPSIPQLEALASAEIYDPATNTFTATGSMTDARLHFSMALLDDGRVLVAGGEDLTRTTLASAELYDPDTGLFTPTGSLATDRANAQVQRLGDGSIFLAGGVSTVNGGGFAVLSAEIYHPDSGSFEEIASLLTDSFPDGASSTRLSSGEILIAGGSSNQIDVGQNTADLFDPGDETFGAVGPHHGYRRYGAMLPLADGQVLFVGGEDNDATGTGLTFNEIYDPATQAFSDYPDALNGPRAYMTASPLPGGDYLLAGGQQSGFEPALATAERYVASTGTFEPVASMAYARLSHTATPLLDGRVLIVGGQTSQFFPLEFVATSEIYEPGASDVVFDDGFDGP